MSLRSLLIGLLLSAAIAAVGYYNDNVLRLTLIAGNPLPISVFGLLVIVEMLINPLLHAFHRSLRLRKGELAVIVAMMLVVCSIPGSGLMRTFHCCMAMPAQHYNKTQAWKRAEVMEYVPDRLLAAQGQYDEDVTKPFVEGGAEGRGEDIGLFNGDVFQTHNVPWGKWSEALWTWYPLLLLLTAAVISLGLIVHRQWAYRERLRYPIATVAETIMQQDEGRMGPIFRNKLFWIGLGAVLALHVVNGLAQLYPGSMISIPLSFPMEQITKKWPELGVPQSGRLFNPTIYLTVTAFAFFLASDVSFSLGVSQVLYILMTAALIGAGIDFSFDYFTGGPPASQRFGSYLGIGLLLVYMGRRYYWQILKAALTFRREEGVESYAPWACRAFIAATVGIVVIMSSVMGLDWPFAILVTFLILLMFLVMARVNAESGLFFIQPWWQPIGVMMGLFGVAALGPTNFMVIGILCMVLTIDPRETLMPFLVNGLKMTDDSRVRPGRMGLAAGWVYVVGLAVATIVVFWAVYDVGGPKKDGWAFNSVPKFPFQSASTEFQQLELAGQFSESEHYETGERLLNMSPDPSFLRWGGIGLALVLGFAVARWRFTWWPLHPVLFLAWGTYPLSHFSHSFLLGWLIKALVTKFGGGRAHRKAIPLMIGIVAGDLLGGLIFMIHGAAYFFITDTRLPAEEVYRIFPS